MRKTQVLGVALVVAFAACFAAAPRAALAQEATIAIGDASGDAGGTANVAVGLTTGAEVVATGNVIGFSPEAQVAINDDGLPDCTVDPSIGKGGFFEFLKDGEAGCTPGDDCNQVKAIIIGIIESTPEECEATPTQCYNLDPIPNGATLFTCNLALESGADGTFPLTCSEPESSDAGGEKVLPEVSCDSEDDCLPDDEQTCNVTAGFCELNPKSFNTACTDGEVTVTGVSCPPGDCIVKNGTITLDEVGQAVDVFFEDIAFIACYDFKAPFGRITLDEIGEMVDYFFEDRVCP